MMAIFSVQKLALLLSIWGILYVVVSGRKVINYSPLEMSRGEMVSYFRTLFQAKVSSMDEANEEIYHTETFAEDLYHNIDNLMPEPIFQKILFKTKNITDKVDGNGFSLLNNYPGTLNTKCSKDSIFNHSLHQMVQTWDGEKSNVMNDIEKWQQLNKLTPYTLICNRFRGLSCQFKRASDPEFDNGKSFEASDNPTCQCAGDSGKIGFYKKASGSSSSYRDGCYVRPWKQCQHLSLDHFFKNNYIQWHTNGENWRRQLAQIVFPVARTHRCKQGTYCVDIVPGMKRPICYCSTKSNDESCRQTAKLPSTRVPLGNELASIRRAFVKLILPSNDTISLCNSEYNEDVVNISKSVGQNPTVTKVLDLMKKLAFNKTKIQICDFREGIFCDEKTSTCNGNLNCGIGKVHLGKGVCAVNNGFLCQGNEDCVPNAKCQLIAGASSQRICVCERGYGHLCELEKAPFFTKLFLPIVSGFQGDKFIKIQTEVNKRVEAWEDSMTLGEGEGCNPVADSASVAIVKYFGNLELYDKEHGDSLLNKVSDALQEGTKLCSYFKFLRCDEVSLKCLPMSGSRVLSAHSSINSNPTGVIVVELEPQTPCQLDLPLIFKDIVVLVCPKGYICKRHKSKGLKVCAPDCNSIFAPVKACPVTPPSTVNMTETEELSNDIERTTASITITTTLSPEEFQETTLPPAPSPAITIPKVQGKNDFDYVKATKEDNYIDDIAAAEEEAKSKVKAFEEIEAQYDSGSRLFLNDSNANREADYLSDKDKPMETPKQNGVNYDNAQYKLTAEERLDLDHVPNDLGAESTLPPPSLRIRVQANSTDPDTTETALNPYANLVFNTGPDADTTETVSNLNTEVVFNTNPDADITTTVSNPTTEVVFNINPDADITTTVSNPNTEIFQTEPDDGIKIATQSPPTAAPISTYLDLDSLRSGALPDNNTLNNTLADEEDVDTTEEPIPPGPKATIGRLCAYNDTRVEYPNTHKHLICDGKLFLVCMDNQCQCVEGLVYYPFLHTCTIPIAERCSPDIWRKRLPPYMDLTNLQCEYGVVCKKDNVHKICRPESDSGLLLRKG